MFRDRKELCGSCVQPGQRNDVLQMISCKTSAGKLGGALRSAHIYPAVLGCEVWLLSWSGRDTVEIMQLRTHLLSSAVENPENEIAPYLKKKRA